MTTLEKFRQEKDQFFRTAASSPLNAEQKKDFQGLNYFPENPALAFELIVTEFEPKEMVEMQTTAGYTKTFQRFGQFTFTTEGQTVQLTMYTMENGSAFVPFIDSLAGTETYPAGRYLEPEPLGGSYYWVDFNYAYNPNCAYNDGWACPLTPFENRLKIPIRAGEKLFHS